MVLTLLPLADWVRLKADLAPPHWRRGGGTAWDQGYEITGYFLDWIDRKYWTSASTNVPRQPNHTPFVHVLNERMRDADYEETIFSNLTGKTVQELWEEYKSELDSGGEAQVEEPSEGSK